MGEERVEHVSYYKENRVDELINGCMRRMTRGQGGSKLAKQHQLCPTRPPTHTHSNNTNKTFVKSELIFFHSYNFAPPSAILQWSVASCTPVCAVCIYMCVCVGVPCMPAGQQDWARCGVGAVGRLGTVGLLIREE